MPAAVTPLDRIFAALGDKARRNDTERADLPVGLIHDDMIPVSGSVLVATRRTISRQAVDRALDKVLRR
jgi:hypothetical protein